MIGLWGIGFFSPELISTALRGESQAVIDRVRALGTALQDVGSFFGMMTFTLIASFLSRRLRNEAMRVKVIIPKNEPTS